MAKSTSPELSDTTFFARCNGYNNNDHNNSNNNNDNNNNNVFFLFPKLVVTASRGIDRCMTQAQVHLFHD